MRKVFIFALAIGIFPTVTEAQFRRPEREVTAIRRNLGAGTLAPVFNDSPQPQAPPPPPGEVGGTGRVNEARSPLGQLRGIDSGPSGVDFTRPAGPGDIARILRGREADLRPCYDRARARRPTLAGRMNFNFLITRDGRVRNGAARGIPAAPEVAQCMATVLNQMRFPPPQGGAAMPFSYAMNFSPPVVPQQRGRGRHHPRRHR